VNENLKPFAVRRAPVTTRQFRSARLSRIKILSGFTSLLILFPLLSEAAQSVTLAWNANPERNIAGYVLRYGTTKGKPTKSVAVGNKTTATVSNLNDSTTYFFTVTARNTFGAESLPSNEVSYKTPARAAHRLSVINGTGSGYYMEGTWVKVKANPPAVGQRFERWTRDWQILSNPFIATTDALMLFRDLTIEATYSPVRGADRFGTFRERGSPPRRGRRF
jgi:hypothetical protein